MGAFGQNTADADAASKVVILVNAEDSASVRIGLHYAEARGIPKKNIISLPLSHEETVSLSEFVETIENPLLEALIEEGWVDAVKAREMDPYGRLRLLLVRHSISYLVLVRGVPLRIENAPEALTEEESSKLPKQFQVTRGSVDSELSLLLAPPGVSMAAFVPNPLFQNPEQRSLDVARLIAVSRLDGPTEASVLSLIDRTMQAESVGLQGRAYFDVGGPHEKGDRWIREAGEMVEAAYFDTDFETSKRVFDYRDRLDAPAIYMGWYRANAYGPWKDSQWAVPPGAIGFHLHSFSAVTVRSTERAWLGDFVNQGFCAMVGNVYEPYLEYTHRPDLLMQYLLEGHRFGDAVMWSHPALSWQGVAIGDPLYRPFKVKLSEQLDATKKTPFRGYSSIREANRLTETDGYFATVSYLRKAFMDQPSLALSLELARKYEEANETAKVLESLGYIRYLSDYAVDERIVVKQIADMLDRNGASDLAFTVYQQLLGAGNIDKNMKVALLESAIGVAEHAGAYTQSTQWTIELRKLTTEIK